MDKIKVLLVDDQLLFVESLKTVLNTRAQDMVVVGVAHDGITAVKLTEKLQPDVILMDVRMPKMNGVESTRIIKEKYPEIRVLMLTTFDDDEYILEALKLGAVGYILKDIPPSELIAAVRAIYHGGVLIAPKVAVKLVNRIDHGNLQMRMESGKPIPEWLKEMSSREKEILGLMAQGYDNKEIARKIYIAEQTVKNYVSIIYSKLGVKDRVQASRMAIEVGLDRYYK
jgi:DNA-binding NarL/FixJ family response regulator